MFAKLPLSWLLLVLGGALNLAGCVAYGTGNSTLNLVGLFYGVPLLLGGFALKAAELKPVVYKQPPTDEVLARRDRLATATQTQVRKDVTRFRYGESAHLEAALGKLGLAPTGEERPVLAAIEEVALEGDRYGLILEFASPHISLEQWQEKQGKLERFFGPGLVAEIAPGEGDRIRLNLISGP